MSTSRSSSAHSDAGSTKSSRALSGAEDDERPDRQPAAAGGPRPQQLPDAVRVQTPYVYMICGALLAMVVTGFVGSLVTLIALPGCLRGQEDVSPCAPQSTMPRPTKSQPTKPPQTPVTPPTPSTPAVTAAPSAANPSAPVEPVVPSAPTVPVVPVVPVVPGLVDPPVKVFTQGKLFYRAAYVDDSRGHLFVGAKEKLFKLPLDDITSPDLKELDLPAPISNVNKCSIYRSQHQLGKDVDCRNHIRVVQPIRDGSTLYICGTNSRAPTDWQIQAADLTLVPAANQVPMVGTNESEKAEGRCPYYVYQSSESLWLDDVYARRRRAVEWQFERGGADHVVDRRARLIPVRRLEPARPPTALRRLQSRSETRPGRCFLHGRARLLRISRGRRGTQSVRIQEAFDGGTRLQERDWRQRTECRTLDVAHESSLAMHRQRFSQFQLRRNTRFLLGSRSRQRRALWRLRLRRAYVGRRRALRLRRVRLLASRHRARVGEQHLLRADTRGYVHSEPTVTLEPSSVAASGGHLSAGSPHHQHCRHSLLGHTPAGHADAQAAPQAALLRALGRRLSKPGRLCAQRNVGSLGRLLRGHRARCFTEAGRRNRRRGSSATSCAFGGRVHGHCGSRSENAGFPEAPEPVHIHGRGRASVFYGRLRGTALGLSVVHPRSFLRVGRQQVPSSHCRVDGHD
ncbi:uncharacterized protein LOC142769687 isoform X1 [Rhipicephalus microplus]|uniref:uncharacterized protein LOC142769687 isoform X1 n=1 Tax=Rhipicephalus microplus TaxID=6941 RepID=UPI003F6BF5E1